MSIADWPLQQRPRERLIREGPRALSDAELLAVFLRVGVPGKSAVELARDMIAQFGSLSRLFGLPVAEFTAIKGLGSAKFAQLQAGFELARRALSEEMQAGVLLNAPQTVKDYLQLTLGNKDHEVFLVLFLDAQNRLLASETMFRGTLTKASVYPREVVKAALAHNAASVILAHNHPSGVAEPSQADETLTHALQCSLTLVDVRVLDHFVVAGSRIYSFAEHGRL